MPLPLKATSLIGPDFNYTKDTTNWLNIDPKLSVEATYTSSRWWVSAIPVWGSRWWVSAIPIWGCNCLMCDVLYDIDCFCNLMGYVPWTIIQNIIWTDIMLCHIQLVYCNHHKSCWSWIKEIDQILTFQFPNKWG